MNGARFVHDWLELTGWRIEIADAQKVKELAPPACNTDRINAWRSIRSQRRHRPWRLSALWSIGGRSA
jgi:transposase